MNTNWIFRYLILIQSESKYVDLIVDTDLPFVKK